MTGKESGRMAPKHILRERVWIPAASSRAQWCLSSPAARGQDEQEWEMQFSGTRALGESLPCAIKTLSQSCCLRERARGTQPALPGGVGRGAGNGNWMLLQSWVGIKGTSQKPAGSTGTSKVSGDTANHPASPTLSCLVFTTDVLIYLVSTPASAKQRFHRHQSFRGAASQGSLFSQGRASVTQQIGFVPLKLLGSGSSTGKSCLQDERRA